VEYKSFATTGTPEIATVVYGQSQVLYVLCFPRRRETSRLQIGTLPLIAVPVGAVIDARLQVFVHVGSDDL
jgi:hypothetical protein